MPSFVRRIEVGGDRDLERHDVRRVVSGVDLRQLDKAANQQSAAGQKHHREADLGDHERTAHAHVPPSRVSAGRRSLALTQRDRVVGASVTKRRHQAEQHAGGDRWHENASTSHRHRSHRGAECSVDYRGRCAAASAASDRNTRTPPNASSTPSSPPHSPERHALGEEISHQGARGWRQGHRESRSRAAGRRFAQAPGSRR